MIDGEKKDISPRIDDAFNKLKEANKDTIKNVLGEINSSLTKIDCKQADDFVRSLNEKLENEHLLPQLLLVYGEANYDTLSRHHKKIHKNDLRDDIKDLSKDSTDTSGETHLVDVMLVKDLQDKRIEIQRSHREAAFLGMGDQEGIDIPRLKAFAMQETLKKDTPRKEITALNKDPGSEERSTSTSGSTAGEPGKDIAKSSTDTWPSPVVQKQEVTAPPVTERRLVTDQQRFTRLEMQHIYELVEESKLAITPLELQESIRGLKAAVNSEKYKDSALLWGQLGIDQEKVGDIAAAVASFTQETRLSPTDSACVRLEQAKSQLAESPTESPESWKLHQHLKPDQKASADPNDVLPSRSMNSHTAGESLDEGIQGFTSKAAAQFGIGNQEEGINLLKEAIHQYPQNVDLWRTLGEYQMKAGQNHDAVYSFTQEVHLSLTSLAADIDSAYIRLGQAQQGDRNFEAALESFTKVINHNSSNASAFDERGQAYTAAAGQNHPEYYKLALDDFSDALDLISKREERKGRNGPYRNNEDLFNDLALKAVYLHRAETYKQMGMSQLSRADRKTAEELDSKYKLH